MRTPLLSALALTAVSSAALAEPVQLTVEQMDEVVAGQPPEEMTGAVCFGEPCFGIPENRFVPLPEEAAPENVATPAPTPPPGRPE